MSYAELKERLKIMQAQHERRGKVPWTGPMMCPGVRLGLCRSVEAKRERQLAKKVGFTSRGCASAGHHFLGNAHASDKRFVSLSAQGSRCAVQRRSTMQGYSPRGIPSPRLVSSNVADPDHLLAKATRLAADKLLNGTPHEVAVAVMSRTLGRSFEKYCRELFDFWGVGSKTVNDGVLYVLALSQREHRIVTGRGIRACLSDDACQEILRDAGKLLKQGDVDAAVLVVARRIVDGIWWGNVRRRLRLILTVVALVCAFLVWRLWRRHQQRVRAYAERASRLKRLAEAAVNTLEERSASERLEANPCPVCLDCLSQRQLHASDFHVQDGQTSVVQNVELLRCGHLAHEPCLSEWLSRSNTCPLCRIDDPRLLGALAAPVALSLTSTETLQQLQEALNWQFEDLGNSRQTYLWQRHFEGRVDEPASVRDYSHDYSPPSPCDFSRDAGSGSSFGGGSCSGGGGAGDSF